MKRQDGGSLFGLGGAAVHGGHWEGSGESDWVQPLGWGEGMPSHYLVGSPVIQGPCCEYEPILQSRV